MNESSFLTLNTRFRPTPYADLHSGHAWVAYHNWAWARNGGGKFIMIVDDIMYNMPNVGNQSFSLGHAVDRYVEDLEWLGIGPDEVIYSTRNADAHGDAAEKLGFPRLGLHNAYKVVTIPTAGRETVEFGYHPWLTMTRVVDDHLAGVTGFWRGMDLIPEMYLYDFVCRSLGWLPPGQGYLPVVRREESATKESKSNNQGISVRQLRERGYHPASVLETIRECGARSVKAGLMDCVIPRGVLELDEINFLPFDDMGNRVMFDESFPWSEDVKIYWQHRDEANALRRRSWGTTASTTNPPEEVRP